MASEDEELVSWQRVVPKATPSELEQEQESAGVPVEQMELA
jgi:hypothetical protein